MKADSSRRLLGHRQKSLYRWTVVALLLTIATHVFAAELSKEEKQKRLEAFREHAQSYQMQLTTDPPTPLKLNPKPLFSWHTARVNLVQQGFVFAWENQGRPEILATIFSHEPAGKPIELLQEMHSLSNSPLTAVKDQQTYWAPKTAGVEPKAVPGAGPVAANRGLRLAQMRKISRRFSGHSINYQNQKSPLQLLPQPIHRTAKDHPSVLDGAVFCLMSDSGTDPEVLVVLEALKDRKSDAWTWHYSLGRFTDLKTWVQLDQEEVWSFAEGTRGPHMLAGPGDIHRFSNEGYLKLEE